MGADNSGSNRSEGFCSTQATVLKDHRSRCGPEGAGHDAQKSGFTSSVWPNQTINSALPQLEAHLLQRGEPRKVLRHAVNAEDGSH